MSISQCLSALYLRNFALHTMVFSHTYDSRHRCKTDREKAMFNWGPCLSDKAESDGRNIMSISDPPCAHTLTDMLVHACMHTHRHAK